MSNEYSKKMVVGFDNGFHDGKRQFITLSSTFSYLLLEAEIMFGPRDETFTFVGVEFREEGQPQLRLSEHCPKHLIIELSNRASTNSAAALSEISHEVVHVLGPVFGKDALTIEEGCAALFARKMCRRFGWADHSDENYEAAMGLVEGLLQKYPDIIKKLRARDKSLIDVQPSQIEGMCPEIEYRDAVALTESFKAFCADRAAKKAPPPMPLP